MINLHDLVQYANDYLSVNMFRDYCPNGLQVEGRDSVSYILSGVTASQALIDEAVERGADAIMVHHGYFWKGESSPLTGIKKQRIATLLRHDISLLAWHLPLDAHPQSGNNAQLAARLGINKTAEFDKGDKPALGSLGDLLQPMSGVELVQHINSVLDTECLHIPARSSDISKVAWCTGGAQSYFEAAIAAGADAFITGESSESCYHLAKEYGVDFFAAGHHATERYGVQALGEHLSKTFTIKHEYMELNNPI